MMLLFKKYQLVMGKNAKVICRPTSVSQSDNESINQPKKKVKHYAYYKVNFQNAKVTESSTIATIYVAFWRIVVTVREVILQYKYRNGCSFADIS